VDSEKGAGSGRGGVPDEGGVEGVVGITGSSSTACWFPPSTTADSSGMNSGGGSHFVSSVTTLW